MSAPRRFLPSARVSLLALAMASPLAFAGHLNILLNASLDGRQEVNTTGNNAMVGDPAGRGEFYAFGIDENRYTLCYNLQVKHIDELSLAPGNGRAAHIHRGKAGENGPIVANIAWPQGGESADCLNGLTQPARFMLSPPSGTTWPPSGAARPQATKRPRWCGYPSPSWRAPELSGCLAPPVPGQRLLHKSDEAGDLGRHQFG